MRENRSRAPSPRHCASGFFVFHTERQVFLLPHPHQAPKDELAGALPVVLRQVGEATAQTVNARNLHVFLQVNTRFNDWIVRRLDQYDFTEGLDYSRESSNDFHLTLDMAKEFCMLERNDRGKQARRYFLACERQLKAGVALDLNDPRQLRAALGSYTEKVIALESKIEADRPKVAFADVAARADGELVPTDFAKEVAPSLGVGMREVLARLVSDRILFRRGKRLRPYQHWIDSGYLRLVEIVGSHPRTGEPVLYPQSVITPQGYQWILDRWNVDGRHEVYDSGD
jgi:anti-repressor protein